MNLTPLDFLKLFNHQKYTLATIKNVSDKLSARSFPVRPEKLPDALKVLEKENKTKDIYFMVNEGDGVKNEAGTSCHSGKNVINLSALFVDAELKDGSDPLPALRQFCVDHFFAPCAYIQTAPNRYHVYWRIASTPSTKENVFKWKQLQAFLNGRLSCDRTMTDIPQLLRIPGFKNHKRNCNVTILGLDDLVSQPLDRYYSFLTHQFPEIKTYKPFEPLESIHESYKVTEGERHEELLRRARKLYAIPQLNDSDVKCFIDGFIQNHIQDNKDFRPGGKRYTEVERLLSAAKSYAQSEKIQVVTNGIIHTQDKKSAYELDQDFYYQAPGIVGDLTRYIVDNSDFPIPSHAFAASVSLVGLTKARYTQGYKQLPPLNYFLCLAPSAAGKTSIQHIIKKILKQLQIRHFLEDGIASAQGLVKFLSRNNGLGIILYDEVKSLFQTIQSRNAASYELKIAQELTQLYTAYRSDYTPPTTKTDKETTIIQKPLFGFIGYGHFTLIEKILNKDNILEGLLPRFLVFNCDERKKGTANNKPIPTDIIDRLRYYVTQSAIIQEDKAKLTDIKLQSPKIQHVTYDTESLTLYNQFEATCDQLYEAALKDREGLEALFSRGCEQVSRLSLAMAHGTTIDPQTTQFCITLVTNQIQNFHENFTKSANRSQFSKDVDRLYEKIIDDCNKLKKAEILKRDLQTSTSKWYKSGEFKTILQALIDQEKIVEVSHGRKILIRLGDVDA